MGFFSCRTVLSDLFISRMIDWNNPLVSSVIVAFVNFKASKFPRCFEKWEEKKYYM